MAGYHFVKSNGHLFKLTKKAYQAWLVDSANRLTKKQSPAKLRNYGADLGEICGIQTASDFELADFTRMMMDGNPI